MLLEKAARVQAAADRAARQEQRIARVQGVLGLVSAVPNLSAQLGKADAADAKRPPHSI
jgi:hypothetical protein